MNCAWCHNPETIRTKQDLHYYQSKCIRCYKCVYACPCKAQKRINNEHRYFPKICVKCGKCAQVCYAGAMEVSGMKKTVDEVMFEINQDQSYYRSSGGGVTLSGGEVLCQKEFAGKLTDACHQEGIQVGIETNLHAPWEEIAEFLSSQDLIMCDLKLFDSEAHKRWTGVGNELIIDNIRQINKLGIPYIVRTPLIPGATDDDGNIAAIAEFLAGLAGTGRMYYELLNYNPLGHSKYESLSKKNPFQDAKPLPATRLAKLRQLAESKGIVVRSE